MDSFNLKDFIEDYKFDFEDFFERYKTKELIKNTEYKEIIDKIKSLKSKYSNVRLYLENSKIIALSNEELTSLLEIIHLIEDMNAIEIREAFKIGSVFNY